ncbi:MAG: MerR family transcriptional regulator [Nitrospirae bacterium]|nr:MerR family transcriptional regulator [Nitrospirota bacterium]
MLQEERLKMSEIARRAAVAPSTIKFYMQQGLLPKPVKTSRNMAYYERSTVERVKLIKELQGKAFLPLHVVRRIMKNTPDLNDIRAYFHIFRGPVAGTRFEPVEEQKLLEEGHLSSEEIKRLARIGVVEPEARDGKRYYDADDAAIVRLLVKMRKAGFNPERGFKVEQLRMYKEALEPLARREVELAVRGVVGKMKVEDLIAVAGEIMSSANELIGVMHRKIVRKMLRSIRKEMEKMGQENAKEERHGR